MKFYDSNLLLLVCMSFTIDRAGFLIFALVFVLRDFELGRNFSVDFPKIFSSHLHEIRYIGTGR